MMTDTAHLTVEGMTCGGCVKNLKAALEAVPGVETADVVLEGGKVSVQYDPTRVKPAAFRQTVEEAGFDVVADK
ncbi:cation/copper resistance transporter ATPase CopZ [Acidomonas methanolica]|nr:copper chaperone [Acidomonas methanolica]GBQ49006.1 cation/copper resistance transporter ATPase CopZ [Acidomonas methanolica]